MGKTEVREPKQKRSIEKKNKIIDAAFKLFCEKGFYNTNTAEIAKVAGVSTGIVYSYFNDKKEIFLSAIKKYSYYISSELITTLNSIADISNLDEAINKILDNLIKTHNIQRKAHEEMEAMIHTDEDVAKFFINFENELCNSIADSISSFGINTPDIHEKVHIIYHLVENFCHEYVYHKHSSLNYDVMRTLTITIVKNILIQK